jgi:thiol-disulfide isomerase/thioredoxin
MLIEINEHDFIKDWQIEIDDLKPLIFSFSTTWCAPCKQFHPTLEKLSEEFPNIIMINCNADRNISLANKFSVKGVPTLLFFKKGIIIDRTIGILTEEDLRKKMENLLD